MRIRALVVVLMMALLLPVVANAQPILKFDDPVTPGGTVSYAGEPGDTAIGTDILFQSIQGLNTPLNPGVTLECVGCLLNFETGPIISEGPPLWNFGPGGTIEVIGAVTAQGAFPGLPAGTLLLSGSFLGTPNEITNGFGLFAAAALDVKNETLATFFGLNPLNFIHGTTSIQTDVTIGANGSFTGTVVNADLNNLQAVVPFPASLLLLGPPLRAKMDETPVPPEITVGEGGGSERR
jgi:hypothetical protein